MLPLSLILVIVGISLFVETVYVVAVPDVANTFNATQSQAMLTMTSYFLGFACAMLFWGIISDRFGRKKPLITGLIIFIISTYGCYASSSILSFTIMRFFQAFGCTAGSVLGQVIIRDIFHGIELAKVNSLLSIAWLGFPAISPLLGGLFIYFFSWKYIFLALLIIGILILFWVLLRLPETIHLNPHNSDDTKKISLFVLAKNMMINKKTLSSILIIAACNGIVFSYYSDGSFYFTKLLGMSETQYSLTFLLILVANFVGGNVSKKLQHILKPKTILHYSIYCAFLGLILFILQIFINEFILKIPYLEWLLFFDLFITFLGIAMVNPNAFFLGLEDYRHCPGRATSIFGFIYCINGATYVFLMSIVHGNSLFIMPLYFICLITIALIINNILLKNHNTKKYAK